MNACLALIHTVPPLVESFTGLCAELLPGVRLSHILDEPLLERIRQRGGLAPEDSRRLDEHARLTEEIGADAILVTCSTVSKAVEGMRRRRLPVVKIDAAMIAEAVRLGPRVGVIATNPTTLPSTRALLEAEAQCTGQPLEIKMVVVENALAALLAGDGRAHDALVRAAVLALAPQVNVVTLAQASTARALAVLPAGECPAPVLTSPRLALQEVKKYL